MLVAKVPVAGEGVLRRVLEAKRIKGEDEHNVDHLIEKSFVYLLGQYPVEHDQLEHSVADEFVPHATVVTEHVQQPLEADHQ